LGAAGPFSLLVGVPELALPDCPKANIGLAAGAPAPNGDIVAVAGLLLLAGPDPSMVGTGLSKLMDGVVVGATVAVDFGTVIPKVVVDVTGAPELVVVAAVVAGLSSLNPVEAPTVGPLAGACPNENMGFEVVILVLMVVVVVVMVVVEGFPNDSVAGAEDFGVPKVING